MSGLVFRPIGPVGDALVVLDAHRRLYAALSHDGAYWHVVSPDEGGILGCSCAGARFRGTCWRLEEAKGYEGTVEASGKLAGAGDIVEAFRG